MVVRHVVLFIMTVGVVTSINLTKFSPRYDVLTVVLNLEAETIGAIVDEFNNSRLTATTKSFFTVFVNSVGAGSLTIRGFTSVESRFFKDADALVPGFSKNAKADIIAALKKYDWHFLFDASYRRATWDAIYYGITMAHDQVDEDFSAYIDEIDSFMTEYIDIAEKEELQANLSAFYEVTEAESPGFKNRVVNILNQKIRDLFATEGEGNQ